MVESMEGHARTSPPLTVSFPSYQPAELITEALTHLFKDTILAAPFSSAVMTSRKGKFHDAIFLEDPREPELHIQLRLPDGSLSPYLHYREIVIP